MLRLPVELINHVFSYVCNIIDFIICLHAIPDAYSNSIVQKKIDLLQNQMCSYKQLIIKNSPDGYYDDGWWLRVGFQYTIDDMYKLNRFFSFINENLIKNSWKIYHTQMEYIVLMSNSGQYLKKLRHFEVSLINFYIEYLIELKESDNLNINKDNLLNIQTINMFDEFTTYTADNSNENSNSNIRS